MTTIYDGASNEHLTGWTTSAAGPNQSVMTPIGNLVKRSRDLVRNNPYAASAMGVLVSNVVGSGIRPRFTVKSSARDALVSDEWDRYSESCDAAGVTDFYGLQALAFRSMLESGEVLASLSFQRDVGGSPGTAIQLLESDYIDSTRHDFGLPSQAADLYGLRVRGGRVVGYWLFNQHPNDDFASPWSSTLHGTDNILRMIEVKRAGQLRGVPVLSPVIVRLANLESYEQAELIRKEIESCFAGYVTSPEYLGSPGDETGYSDEAGRAVKFEDVRPGTIRHLPPGASITFASPQVSPDYPAFVDSQLRAVASGLGVPHFLLTSDLSNVNFSSARIGLHEFRRRVRVYQERVIVHQFCKPIMRRFIDTLVASGKIPVKHGITVDWVPQRFEPIDPVDEAKADVIRLEAGLASYQEIIAHNGRDFADVVSEIKAFQELMPSEVLPKGPYAAKTDGPEAPVDDPEGGPSGGDQSA